MSEGATRKTIEAVWRIESARLIGGLVRAVRDVDLAEDLAQEALVTALERWPETGIPDKPGAWLMTTAKNRAIDLLRRRKMVERRHGAIAETGANDSLVTPEIEAAIDDNVGDDLLRLILIASHPVLSTEARVALTLRLLGGLTTEEIARAFLVPEATVAQRIVRAKRTLAEARVPYMHVLPGPNTSVLHAGPRFGFGDDTTLRSGAMRVLEFEPPQPLYGSGGTGGSVDATWPDFVSTTSPEAKFAPGNICSCRECIRRRRKWWRRSAIEFSD